MEDSRASSALSDRDGSTSPSLSATVLRSSYAPSDRSFSATSSVSSYSEDPSSRRSSSFGATSKRRGYVRTQGAEFAESAKHRESVMSLGSIAHLQYYFARTGLLDGKGGQLAKLKKNGELDIPQLRLSTIGVEGEITASPTDEGSEPEWDVEPTMLPPTVSTYAHRPHTVQPPPDMKILKKELVQALENALQVLEAIDNNTKSGQADDAPGFHEIQGLQVLDVTTLAIRAARVYYHSHANPARLATIKPEKVLRSELISVMEILKKYATRKFAGGLKEDEKLGILVWVSDVSQMINTESKLEEAERRERENWTWMHNEAATWYGREKEREWNFLSSLLTSIPASAKSSASLPDSLPQFSSSPASSAADALLTALSDGRVLVHLHNSAVKLSKRPFGNITSWHTDIAKPYRRADNLRFWVKAAEIRWEIHLDIDVMGIVYHNEDPVVWEKFEAAVLQWCTSVREEISGDWKLLSPMPTGTEPTRDVVMAGGHERNDSAVTITPQSLAVPTADH